MPGRPILVLTSSHKHTGPGRVALHHARLLREAGREVLFRCRPGGTLETRAREAELWAETAARESPAGRGWSLPRDVARLRGLLRRHRPGAVFAYRSPEHLAALLASGRRAPVVRFLHDADRLGAGRGLAARALRKLLRHPATGAVLTPDPAAPPAIEARVGGERPVRFVPGGVDTDHLVPDLGGTALRRELGLGDEAVVAGLVARCKPGRGHDRFLDALARGLETAPALRGLLVGGGEEAEQVRDHARRLGIADRVALFHSDTRFEEALGALDLGVLVDPGSAGTGQAALELMSMARPVIVRPRGVLAHLAGETRAARTLPDCPDAEAEAAALGAALAELATDPAERLRMGRAARERARSAFGRSALQEILSGLLRDLGA